MDGLSPPCALVAVGAQRAAARGAAMLCWLYRGGRNKLNQHSACQDAQRYLQWKGMESGERADRGKRNTVGHRWIVKGCIGLDGMFEFWKGKQLEDTY